MLDWGSVYPDIFGGKGRNMTRDYLPEVQQAMKHCAPHVKNVVQEKPNIFYLELNVANGEALHLRVQGCPREDNEDLVRDGRSCIHNWYKANLIPYLYEDFWHIFDTEHRIGNTWRKGFGTGHDAPAINPTYKTVKGMPDENGYRYYQERDFKWILPATSENLSQLIEEIMKRYAKAA